LSLGRAITPLGLGVSWGVYLVCAGAALAWKARSGTRLRMPILRPPNGWMEWTVAASTAAVLIATGLVAWFAPPSTWDSLNYHMPRVAHWAQQRTLRPFPTGIDIQNSQSPGAELLVLHLYVLARGDRPANFVAWFAFAGSLAAAGIIVKRLGGDASAERMAPLMAATLPMALVQASSAMTDGVAGFWCLCAGAECLSLREGDRASILWAGAAAGLGLLTKPTAFAFLLPFGVWAAILIYGNLRRRKELLAAGAAVGLIFLINAGHSARNLALYGLPMNPERVARHANGLRNLRGLGSNLIRYASVQFGTPSPIVNRAITLAVLKAHEWLDVDPNDPRTTSTGNFNIRPPLTQEDLTINPLHAVLFSWAFFAVLARREVLNGAAVEYALISAAGMIVFCAVFKWEVFGGRYLLPLFMVFAPAAGLAVGRLARPALQVAIAVLLLVGAWPWLTGIRSRPLIERPGDSVVRSVLVESRETLLFANGLYLQDPQAEIAAEIVEASCGDVGLMLGGNSAEYPLWVLLGAPREGLRLEWIVAGTASARFEERSFEPCAVVCDESCPADWERVRGLPLRYEQSGFRLFMASGE
jgi:hypothetical protein